jgi:hypothetical protein
MHGLSSGLLCVPNSLVTGCAWPTMQNITLPSAASARHNHHENEPTIKIRSTSLSSASVMA